jgi:hypothetical protein
MYIFLYFQYPYIPAHITKPKEHKRLFLVQLPEKGPIYYNQSNLYIKGTQGNLNMCPLLTAALYIQVKIICIII